MAKANSPTQTINEELAPSQNNTQPRVSDAELCNLVIDNGTPFITAEELAPLAGYSYSYTLERLHSLCETDWLTKEKPYNNTIYFALFGTEASKLDAKPFYDEFTHLHITPSASESPPLSLEERIDEYEQYWRAVDATRFFGPIILASDSTKHDSDESPIAAAYMKAKTLKNNLREECQPLPGTLPQYREQFNRPTFDFRHPTPEETAQFDLQSSEDDDPIFLPTDFTISQNWSEQNRFCDEPQETQETQVFEKPEDPQDPEVPEAPEVTEETEELVVEVPDDAVEQDTDTITLSIDINIEVPSNANVTAEINSS